MRLQLGGHLGRLGRGLPLRTRPAPVNQAELTRRMRQALFEVESLEVCQEARMQPPVGDTIKVELYFSYSPGRELTRGVESRIGGRDPRSHILKRLNLILEREGLAVPGGAFSITDNVRSHDEAARQSSEQQRFFCVKMVVVPKENRRRGVNVNLDGSN